MKEVNNKKKKIDMGYIKKFLKDNKKTFIVAGIILLVVVILIAGAVSLFGNKESNIKSEYEKSLREMGKDFYENYYYDRTGKTDEERGTFLKKYSSTGIKVDLENLARYNAQVNKAKIDELTNKDNKYVCNTKNTRVIIIPKDGYKKTDYEIKIELDCGFIEEK